MRATALLAHFLSADARKTGACGSARRSPPKASRPTSIASISSATPRSRSTTTASASSGIAHVALADDHAELGLSVLPAHRGRGVGSALFERGAEHARNRFVRTLFMHCLRENAAIVHIAQRVGMQIVTESGDADAHLELLPASAGSIADELVDDRVALYDYALKAQVAAWKGVNVGARRGVPPHPLRCAFRPPPFGGGPVDGRLT